jgi:GTP-binding protein Era
MPRGPRGARSGSPEQPARAGTIALVGRPNVGKSTLVNAMLGEHITITSHHPQTTRDRIAGIVTRPGAQLVFYDTPGLHAPKNRLGQRMNDVATGTASDCDVVVCMVDVGPAPTAEVRKDDADAIAQLPDGKPCLLVVNKIDRVKEKALLLAFLEAHGKLRDFTAIVPISARTRDGIEPLLDVLTPLLPEGEPLYPEDELSDRPVRFFIAELVREQVLARTRQEVPHGVAVTVDAFEETKKMTRVTLSVHVAKESHKGIIIGQGGKMLVAIGTVARERAERLLGRKVHLDIHVRTTAGWFDDAARLADLGYADDDGGKAKPTRPSSPRPAPKPAAAAKTKGKASRGTGARS